LKDPISYIFSRISYIEDMQLVSVPSKLDLLLVRISITNIVANQELIP